jgi:hypothetical protein
VIGAGPPQTTFKSACTKPTCKAAHDAGHKCTTAGKG